MLAASRGPRSVGLRQSLTGCPRGAGRPQDDSAAVRLGGDEARRAVSEPPVRQSWPAVVRDDERARAAVDGLLDQPKPDENPVLLPPSRRAS